MPVNGVNEQAAAFVSQLSRARASAGETNFSAETQRAIEQGALPPVVVEPREREVSESVVVNDSTAEITREFETVVAETSRIQQGEQPDFSDEAVVVALSEAANAVARSESGDSRDEQVTLTSDPVRSQNQDTASTAFGNAVDIQA